MPTFPREKVESPDKTDFYFVEVTDPDKAVDMVRRMVCEHIPQKFGFDRVDDIQVLSPMQGASWPVGTLTRCFRRP